MRRLRNLLLCLLLGAWNSVWADTYYQVVRHPSPFQLPDVVLVDLKGEKTSLSALRGRFVLLNLWATWCAPCVKELPSLDALQKILGKERILVVALSQDRVPKSMVPAYLEKLNIQHLTSYYDPQGVATRAFRVPVLPTTLMVDARGREVGRIIGALDWASPEGQDIVKKLTK